MNEGLDKDSERETEQEEAETETPKCEIILGMEYLFTRGISETISNECLLMDGRSDERMDEWMHLYIP